MNHPPPQKTQYCYLVEKLPVDVVEEVTDLLENVPEDNSNERVKEVFLKQTRVSNETMLHNLFTQVEWGDHTPLQLLCHMQTLLGDNKIMLNLWVDKLPAITTQIFAPMTEERKTEKLADIADRIHESLWSCKVTFNCNQHKQEMRN